MRLPSLGGCRWANLALEREFEAVRTLLDDVLRFSPNAVTLVPGNHDVYTRGAEKNQRFARYFEPYLTSDLPKYRTRQPGGLFPVVKLRDKVAAEMTPAQLEKAQALAAAWKPTTAR